MATGILRYGTSYKKAAGYDRYAYVIVGPGDASAASRLAGRSLVYKSGTSVYTAWSAGMTYKEALANGWLLKGMDGSYLMNNQFGAYVGDLGDAGYQRRFVTLVLAFLKQHGNDGVFLDDVLLSPLSMSGQLPAKYPSNRAWEDATVAFVTAVGDALSKKGYYLVVNAAAWVPGDAPTTTIEEYTRFYTRLAPHVGGVMNEYWMQTSDGARQLRSVGPNWNQGWSAWQELLRVTQEAGADFFGLMYGSFDDTRSMRYGRAAFLLDWNGKGGAFMFSVTDRDDPFHPAWVKQLGQPLTPKFQRSSNVWQRRYEGGIVVLNANDVPVSVRIGESRFTIGPTDALFARAPRAA